MKKHFLTILILIIVQVSFSQIRDIEKYVFEKYEVIIKSKESDTKTAGIIYDNPNKGYDGEPCGNSYWIYEKIYKNINYLVLEKVDCNDNENREIVDILLPFHEFGKNGDLRVLLCDKNKVYDSKIIAITTDKSEDNEKEYFVEVRVALTLDLNKEKIVRIDSKDIRCENVSHGI